MMSSKSIRFSHEEINAFVFNHVHCQYSSNQPADQVLFEGSGVEPTPRTKKGPQRKGFFNKVQESCYDTDSDNSSHVDKKKETVISNHDSDNSFAQELYK
mmetsp:Transcript_15745/g.13767  ORF Transcript_15745/g.13767 Transcript_15745/m.13767 type:complete len:100 (-) Transcript_15745:32-331(-)